jgi:hypothetical protein
MVQNYVTAAALMTQYETVKTNKIGKVSIIIVCHAIRNNVSLQMQINYALEIFPPKPNMYIFIYCFLSCKKICYFVHAQIPPPLNVHKSVKLSYMFFAEE